jgi:MATE family multidrug resistance protein
MRQDRTPFAAHLKAVLALGLPLAGSHLAQIALHVTDTVMVGWYGVTELAAVVLGSATFFIFFILGSGFAQAVMPMVAVALGRGDETQVRRDTRMALWLSALYGVAIYPALWWSGSLLLALGQAPEVAALAQDYLRVAGAGMVPALLIMGMKGFLSSVERAGVVLWTTLAATVVNAALNWAFIFGNWGAPELGVQGSALASVVAQVLTFVILAAVAGFDPALARFRLFARFWRPDWAAFAQVWRLGWPIGMTGLFEAGMFETAALMMGWIGTKELAAHGIALQLGAISFMVYLGLSNAATVRAGRTVGTDDTRSLRDGAMAAIALVVVVAGVVVAAFLTVPELLVGLFLDPANPETPAILAYGATLLAVAALFQLADAAQVMALGLLRGVHDTRGPMVIASVGYWLIGIPSSYVLAFRFGLGGVGVWIGLVIGLVFAGTLLMTRFWRGPWLSDRPADSGARRPA